MSRVHVSSPHKSDALPMQRDLSRTVAMCPPSRSQGNSRRRSSGANPIRRRYARIHMATLNGTIKRLVTDKGFGFVQAQDGTEYFFHQSACTDTRFDDLTEGQALSSRLGEARRDRAPRTSVWRDPRRRARLQRRPPIKSRACVRLVARPISRPRARTSERPIWTRSPVREAWNVSRRATGKPASAAAAGRWPVGMQGDEPRPVVPCPAHSTQQTPMSTMIPMIDEDVLETSALHPDRRTCGCGGRRVLSDARGRVSP